ncbi:uncharacterized protein [Neodiprion pinetum]|uniref:uncharacterized protein n=1 Tax=Neodiprion pinetum TaxID=441929 RepID=UPI001EDD7627|nr:uncharacterized protein LOC124212815 [Neodiprion pinetum]
MSGLKMQAPPRPSAGFGTRTKNETPDMKEQYLFLLEFFVHSISGERLAKLNQMFFVPTSVCFRFLTFNDDSIEVTPVDPMFEPQAGIADEIEYFYSGRSVMFAIAEDVVVNKISEFNVALIVQKKMPDNIKPNVLVGVSFIDLSKQFAELRCDLQCCSDNQIPPPQSCEGEYPLLFNGEMVGEISLYTRLSAFGQTIVTEFDAPPDKAEKQSTFLFRGDEIEDKTLAYKCRMINSSSVDICRESTEELGQCPICEPPHFSCLPCGLSFGAVARPMSPALTEIKSPIQTSASYPSPTIGSGPIQSSRGGPCGKAVVLKVSGLLDAGDGSKQPTVTVVPESEATGPNNPPDSEHDVFILRIGKKGLVAEGEKSDLQLEMRTPKGPERRPPIRHVPVPKPKTPPLPKLVRVEPAEDPPMAKDKKGGKKKEKGKGKKK